MSIGRILSTHGLFAAAFVLLVVINLVVLAGVAANRTGSPEYQLSLTERELGLGGGHGENSGLRLHLSWRTLPRGDGLADGHFTSPVWFDAAKLSELGIPIPPEQVRRDARSYKTPVSKEVFIVLELGGAPYAEALRRAQHHLNDAHEQNRDAAERRLKRERHQLSRLFAVDAGLEPVRLRQLYPDRMRFVIVRGQVKPVYGWTNETAEIFGRIDRLSIPAIHVPREHRPLLDGLPATRARGDKAFLPPRFSVTLAYGSRFEPWILEVASLDPVPPERAE